MWRPLEILIVALGGKRDEMADRALRWTRAFREHPELQTDLIELSGLLEQVAQRFENGVPVADPMNGERLAYERGRTDMALTILALGGLSQNQLNQLMRDYHEQ